MPPAAVTVPKVLSNPGFLFIAPLASTLPNMGESLATASAFTDAWPAAWLPLGATEEGSTFSYSTSVEPIEAAEFFDPISYATVSRAGSIAFNLVDWTLSNYRRAMNGGVAALTPAIGTGATAVYKVEPPTPGAEVRCMVGWESLSNDVRIVCRQTIQGGEITSAFNKAPAKAAIPCTFNLEMPVGSTSPFVLATAGSARG